MPFIFFLSSLTLTNGFSLIKVAFGLIVISILKKVAKDKLVVMVTHNIEQVEQYATRIIKMHDGRIVENNEIKKIEDEPKVEESKYKNLIIRLNFSLVYTPVMVAISELLFTTAP